MKLFFSVVAILFVSVGALAQEGSSTSKLEKEFSSEGMRVSVLFPMIVNQIESRKNKTEDVSSIGLGVGYASLPLMRLGWTSNLSYIQSKFSDSEINALRLDGNLAFAFHPSFNVKGGINYTKFMSEGIEDSGPRQGFQASLGYQLTKNFSADIGYVSMRGTGEASDNQGRQYFQSGTEVALSGTF